MTFRLAAIVLTLSVAAGGCSTTTAHRLPFADNPRREQALACEAQCRPLAARGLSGHKQYAECIDRCPGAVATESDCPAPVPGVICVETHAGNFWGLLVVAGAVVLSILLLGALHTAFSFA